jgi:hypothetical protein
MTPVFNIGYCPFLAEGFDDARQRVLVAMAASRIKSIQPLNTYKKSSGTPKSMTFRLNSDSTG